MKHILQSILLAVGLNFFLIACQKPAEPERSFTVVLSSAEEMLIYPSAAGKTYERGFTVTPAGKQANVRANTNGLYADFDVTVNYDDITGKGTVKLTRVPESLKESLKVNVYVSGEVKRESNVAAFPISAAKIAGPSDPVLLSEGVNNNWKVNVNANIPFVASCDASWVHNITVSEKDVIFSVEANESYLERETVISLFDETRTVTGSIAVKQGEVENPMKGLNEVELLLRIAHKFRDAGHESPQWKMWEEYYEAHKDEFTDPNSILYTRPLYYYTGDGCILPTNGHVAYLHLDGTTVDHPEFEIEIPEEIGYFPYMDELWCSRGGFIGNIPESFQRLSRLVDMNFTDNKLSGEMPIWLVNLPRLKSLHLYNNYFTGNIPEEFANFPDDFFMDFYGNCMDGEIPAAVANCGWWNDVGVTGIKHGQFSINMGQREGHRLWLPGEE